MLTSKNAEEVILMAKKKVKKQYAEFNVTKFGLAAGITWGLGVLFLGIIGMYGYDGALIGALGSIYVGYAPTIIGSLIGALWALGDGFIGGVIFAWIYNKLR